MLSIVIPAYGSAPRLRCALRCLLAAIHAEQSNAEIIVVNDGASPAVRACLEALPQDAQVELLVIDTPRQGRSAARNVGAANARGNRLLFLDSDILAGREVIRVHSELGAESTYVIVRGAISHLPWLAAFVDPQTGELTVEASRSLRVSNGDSCLLASRTLSDGAIQSPHILKSVSRTTQFQRDLQRWFLEGPSDVSSSWIGCTGGQFSVDPVVFQNLGGFDEEMGLRWGAEDLEFGYRAMQSGVRVIHSQISQCYHMDHTSAGRNGDHEWALNYFAAKHGNPGIVRLLDYFGGKCNLKEALEECHATA